ncbi:MAG TPA: ABC transporter ATP-binding protein [Candidatus Avamphibacillus intestinigallinarum]|nr:ABC transporter ATP-binding protein [Candidatus Avamphibacillus intestinigallinarum]
MSLTLNHVSKVYQDGKTEFKALDDVSLNVQKGEFVGIIGPSGSGKSTLLSVAGALLEPTTGKVIIAGEDTSQLTNKQITELRLDKIGFIFQAAHLIPYLKIKDQLQMINVLAKQKTSQQQERVKELLEHFGLGKTLNQYPNELSGGQRQRVAIARSLMNDPEIIFADEPTASLDSKRGRDVVERLSYEVKTRNKTGIMVTHDERVLDLCDRVITIVDGQLVKTETGTVGAHSW